MLDLQKVLVKMKQVIDRSMANKVEVDTQKVKLLQALACLEIEIAEETE